MLNAFLRLLFGCLLSLRYRIDVVGLEQIPPKDERGMLFLPNHPALIDPLILLLHLTARFPVRPLAERTQVDRPGIRWLGKRVNVRLIMDPEKHGSGARLRTAAVMRDLVRGLRRGEALLFYPAGRVYRSKFEDLRKNSAVEFLLRACPTTRIVLIRTHGLWGSAFGRGSGASPSIGAAAKRGIIGLVKSGILFMPKRHVRIEFVEPEDFPRDGDAEPINRYLEAFYNAGAPPNTYVPYSIWERRGPRPMPEPGAAVPDE